MRPDWTKPWRQKPSGCGIVVESAKGYPLAFVYGISAKSQQLADEIMKAMDDRDVKPQTQKPLRLRDR
jgi:hypothetical protein